MVPGGGHCGPAPNYPASPGTYHVAEALVSWVEHWDHEWNGYQQDLMSLASDCDVYWWWDKCGFELRLRHFIVLSRQGQIINSFTSSHYMIDISLHQQFLPMILTHETKALDKNISSYSSTKRPQNTGMTPHAPFNALALLIRLHSFAKTFNFLLPRASMTSAAPRSPERTAPSMYPFHSNDVSVPTK